MIMVGLLESDVAVPSATARPAVPRPRTRLSVVFRAFRMLAKFAYDLLTNPF